MVTAHSHSRHIFLTFRRVFVLLLSSVLLTTMVMLGADEQQAGQEIAHAQDLPTSTPHKDCGWQVSYPAADATNSNFQPVGTLAGVTALSSDDVWAVGYQGTVLGRETNTQTLHWNGSEWKLVPSPFHGLLQSVSALSATDVWAVGTDRSSGDLRPLTLHWDGEVWSRVPVPSAAQATPAQLAGVVAVSLNDVWAVGTTEPLDGTAPEGLTMHWDGGTWAVVPNPGAEAAGRGITATSHLLGVAATGPVDVWAVGWYATDVSGQKALVLHWDGQAWAILPTEQVGLFNAVAASTPHDVWAVGVSTPGAGSLTEHWDGSSWIRVPSPNPGSHLPDFSNANVLRGVYISSSDNVWAVGSYADYGSGDNPLALHWNGRNWVQVNTPAQPETPSLFAGAEFLAVSARPNNEAWAVGFRIERNHAGVGIVERYLQTDCQPPITPTPTPSPTVPGSGSRLFPQTKHTVSGLFLDYWNNHGGVMQQGYPISDLLFEVSELDGKPYVVQYFERAVFEYHPEQKPPFNVLLSQLGALRSRSKYPYGAPGQEFNTSVGSVFIRETGKRLGGAFLDYWKTHGDIPQQGFPISNEFMEKSDLNGKEYRVQYFERLV